MIRSLSILALACASLLWLDLALAVDEAVVQGCQACHRGAASLASGMPTELGSQITAIIDGAVPHPVPLPTGLTPEDVQALAEALSN